MSTAYGTISTTPSTGLSHDRQNMIRSGVGIRRPWKQMASFSIPESFNVALQRLKTNASYFQVNYVIVILFAVFLSLLWHPVSLLVFIFAIGAWLFLYLLRDEPVVVFGYGVDERVILVLLSISTLVLLLLTHATVSFAGVAVGLVVVVLHGAFRRTNDLFSDEEQGVRGDHVSVDLKETASASFSSPF
ncbi:PRA1 family protein F2-like [Henckelia pumila]|uniref:PRA1 family protein F2-like n=1 Tax=Henckelia pumila TaxID=405737 RepID=UPI003C6E285C